MAISQRRFLTWSIWLAIGILIILVITRAVRKEGNAATEGCHDNMNRLALAVLQYHAEHQVFPDSLNQLRIAKLDSNRLICPLTRTAYKWELKDSIWTIECPIGHGKISNGIADW